jgi:hypothetical protein
MVQTSLLGSSIKSDTDGEVPQPSAYSDDDCCEAISDERNGSRNSAHSATAAVPTTSVTIGRALQPFPRSKRSMRLSPHCAFQVGPDTHEGQTRGCPRGGAPAGQAYRHLLSSLHPFAPLSKDIPWRTFTLSVPLQDSVWLLRRLRPLSRTLAFSRPLAGQSGMRVPQFQTKKF